MRKHLWATLIALVLATPAAADWTAKDGSNNTITFSNPAACTSVTCVPVAQIYDGTNVVTLTTAGANGASNTLTGLPTYSRLNIYNGTTWDRWTGAVTQSGTWNITNISGTVSLPTGAATSANQPSNSAIGATTSGQTGTLSMGATTTSAPTYTTAQTNPLSLDTAGNLRVNVTTATGVAQGSTTSGQTGDLIMGAVTTGSPSYTTAQTSPLSLDTSGNLRVNVVAGGAGGGAVFGPTAVGSAAANPPVLFAGTANAGATGNVQVAKVTSGGVLSSDLSTVNGVTTLTGSGAVGTGSARVAVGTDTATIAGSAPGTAGSASSNVLTVQGIASMTPILANPGTAANWGVVTQGSTTSGQSGNLIQGAVTTSSPSYTTAQTSPLSLDTSGNLRVNVVTGGAGGGAVFGPTAVGSAAANPPVLFAGTANAGATGNVQVAKVTSGGVISSDLSTVNGVTTLTGSGAVGTGSARVAVGTDTATIAGSAPGTAGSASSNVLTVQGIASMTPVSVSGNTGAATTTSTTMQNGATANGNGTNLTVTNYTNALVNVNCSVACSGGTTINFEGTDSTGTFFSIAAIPVAGGAAVTTATTSGQFWVPAASLTSIRARISGYSAGTITVTGTPINGAVPLPSVSIPGSVTVTATNLSTNEAQIAGTTPDVNSGNLSAGTQRVTLATNSAAIANYGQGATGAAAPSGAVQMGVIQSGATGGFLKGQISCDNHVFKHITTATDTLAVQGVASQTIYVCSWRSRAAGVATWYLENTASTNANCSSTLTQITGVATEAANTGETWGSAFWSGLKNTSGNGLCINSTGTGGVDVDIWYTQF